MKKLIILAITLIMLITFTSCGESVVCDGCYKEIKLYQSKTGEMGNQTLCLCVDCYDLLEAYKKGDAVQCDFCNDLVMKTDAHINLAWGEPIYICEKCYDDIRGAN